MYSLPPLTNGHILKRYKRFLADIRLEDGRIVTAHCPNTGAMTSCWQPDAAVQLSYSDNPKRKLAWTLERIDMGRGWIGVNTLRVNHIVAAAIQSGHIPQLSGYRVQQREPAFAAEGFAKSRFDLLLSAGGKPDAYVEIKNTTLIRGDAIQFPDAVTERGRKHLLLLREAVRRGYRGIVIYALNRPEGKFFEPAWEIDPEYGYTLERVTGGGVEVLAVRLKHLDRTIEVAGTRAARWHRQANARQEADVGLVSPENLTFKREDDTMLHCNNLTRNKETTVSAKSQNPFDFSQYFTQIDPKAVLDQWQQMFTNSALPHVDTAALFETQSKNLYALIAANQSVMAGARNLLQRQGELMQEALKEANDAVQSMGKITDPNEAVAKQTELVQAACDKALANSKEISEMIAKNYQEAAEAINQRFSEALNEIKNSVGEKK